MPITEAERHEMHARLTEMLGAEQAGTLMEHLPPVGWADVATKTDLANVEESLRSEISHVERSLGAEMVHLGDRIENRLLREQRTYLFALLSAFVAVMGLTLALL